MLPWALALLVWPQRYHALRQDVWRSGRRAQASDGGGGTDEQQHGQGQLRGRRRVQPRLRLRALHRHTAQVTATCPWRWFEACEYNLLLATGTIFIFVSCKCQSVFTIILFLLACERQRYLRCISIFETPQMHFVVEMAEIGWMKR